MQKLIINEKKVHFIGIGGISMSGLARILRTLGIAVSGSDRTNSEALNRLRLLGVDVFIGHKAGQHGDASLVVYTPAIAEDNPELSAARQANIPTIRRDELLGRIIRQYKTSIGIAGMHGKSTCTSMTATVLLECHKDPTIHIGAVLPSIGGSVRVGGNEFFVTEADEYKESFLKFPPTVAVLLNIDEDHLDYYRDINHIIEAFTKYVALLPAGGACIANGDDPLAVQVMKGAPCPGHTFGLGEDCEWRAVDIVADPQGCHRFTVLHNGERSGEVALSVPGRHHVYNALAAIAASVLCGVDPEQAAQALAHYVGAERRFMLVGAADGCEVYHDYAHHPAEIRATLEAAALRPHNRLWCVFQPHTYTRTKALFQQFASCFAKADQVVLTDIYAAREPDPGDIHSTQLCDAINGKLGAGRCRYAPTLADAAALVKAERQPGDLILTVGAGDIEGINKMLL